MNVIQFNATMYPVHSSQISAIGFQLTDPVEQEGYLQIEFKGKGGKPGALYQYAPFPKKNYDLMFKAKSKGDWFSRYVKEAKVPYEKVGAPKLNI